MMFTLFLFAWVQLYYAGKDMPEGRPTSVRKPLDLDQMEWNVDALTKAAKVEMKEDLTHCSPAKISVFPPGTKPPFSEKEALLAWDPIPSTSSGLRPFIVVAPAPQELRMVADESPRELVPLSANPEDSRLLFSQVSSHFRQDWKSSPPTKFNIGPNPSLSRPILDKTFIESFVTAVESNEFNSFRRGILSIVVMPGWGKTFAMDILAKLTVVARKKASGLDLSDGEDLVALSVMLDKIDTDECLEKSRSPLLQRCVPLVITLNSFMNLGPKPDDKDSTTWFSSEIAKRLIYAYFADVTKVSYPRWEGTMKREKDSLWLCDLVLECLYDFASTTIDDPILLLLIDEPDKTQNAIDIVGALSNNALLYPWKASGRERPIECRVVMSALEQHWLFAERTSSGRPIKVLRIDPPKDNEVVAALMKDFGNELGKSVDEDTAKNLAAYITALAGGHWRTIANINEQVKNSGQLAVDALKESVGRAKVYVPTSWQNSPINVVSILEEALAHAILGSKLDGMEPIHDGTAWQAVTKGVILQYLGLETEKIVIDPVVPMLIVLGLAQHQERNVQDKQPTTITPSMIRAWKEQDLSEVRNTLLLKVLAYSRFFPSENVLSSTKSHKLYESMVAQFILLKWDARARIDKAVQRRWGRAKEDLMVIPPSLLKQKLHDIEPYKLKLVAKLRDSMNMAWVNSLNPRIKEVPSEAPKNRPNLWLVAPSEIADEMELRLCIFRGAICCTKSRGSIQVLPPNPKDAKYYKCNHKLWNENARLSCNKKLVPGSVIEPANGNEGFDSLTVLSKASGDGSVITLVENKFEKGQIGVDKVKKKLDVLTKAYRGKLWIDPMLTKPNSSKPTQIEALQLPELKETDVVWVVLADSGYTKNLSKLIKVELMKSGAFQGHVMLMTSQNFFGPSFRKLGILDQNKKHVDLVE